MTISTPEPLVPSVDADLFRRAMRLPATAVTVIASGSEGARVGLTASAVCSLSDSPPMVLVCVNRSSHALEAIRRNASFSVNFLAADQQETAEIFAGRKGLYGEDRFVAGEWQRLISGAPVMTQGLASFDCLLEVEHDSPTHAILIGRIVAIASRAAAPLIYCQGQFGQPQ